MQNRFPLPAKQGVHRDAGFHRHFLEAAPVDFMGDEYVALLGGQFIKRLGNGIEPGTTQADRFRAAVVDGQRTLKLGRDRIVIVRPRRR